MDKQLRDQKVPDGNTGKTTTEQKQKELQGAEQKGSTNPPPNQNPGKGAPARHPHPDNASAEYQKQRPDKEESLSDGKGTQNQREDAALVKEQIRSRDA